MYIYKRGSENPIYLLLISAYENFFYLSNNFTRIVGSTSIQYSPIFWNCLSA